MIYVFEGGSIVYDGTTIDEEQKSQAIAIESLPKPETPKGKYPVIKVDKSLNKVWWEYIDLPEDNEFDKLQEQIQDLQIALAELTIYLAGGEM